MNGVVLFFITHIELMETHVIFFWKFKNNMIFTIVINKYTWNYLIYHSSQNKDEDLVPQLCYHGRLLQFRENYCIGWKYHKMIVQHHATTFLNMKIAFKFFDIHPNGCIPKHQNKHRDDPYIKFMEKYLFIAFQLSEVIYFAGIYIYYFTLITTDTEISGSDFLLNPLK